MTGERGHFARSVRHVAGQPMRRQRSNCIPHFNGFAAECSAPHPNATFALSDQWIANWRDRVDFEIVLARTSAEALNRPAPQTVANAR
jgi:hypothetical protein